MFSAGDKIDRLELKERTYKVVGKRKRSFWRCLCSCGKEFFAREDALKSGGMKSCGCFSKENLLSMNLKHGKYIGVRQRRKNSGKRKRNVQIKDLGMNSEKLHSIWRRMKERCYNPNHLNYDSYGGRGITIDESWLDFEKFYRDMVDSYQKGLSIDRIDVNKGYSKENCRWATSEQQANNKQNTVYITFRGEELPLMMVYKKYAIQGLAKETFSSRIKRGWDVEKALNTPARKRKSNN